MEGLFCFVLQTIALAEFISAQSLSAGEGFVRKSRYPALKHPTAAIISDGDIFNILYGVFMPVFIFSQ